MTDKPLKIVKLTAENFKKLSAVSITPQGNVVQITGRNGSGKSSTLDSIYAALAGAGASQPVPIRKGQDRAVIKLDLGEVTVTRTFTQRDGKTTPALTIESGDSYRRSPQTFLDGIVGELSFDPLGFARMKPKDQYDTLKGFVPDVDFTADAAAHQADYEKRREVNRRANDLAAQANAIAIPDVVPTEKVDESALVQEIAGVGEHNAQIERRIERRQQVASDLAKSRERIKELRAKAAELVAEADNLDENVKNGEKMVAEAPPLPERKDAAEVRKRLEDAKRTNALVDQVARRATLQADADKAKREAEEITGRMDAREQARRDAIAAAKLPVDGLGFGDGYITLNGVPFEQASSAEQLRASIAMAMAANPRLKVILVRDGSLLDDDSMRIVTEMAEANDCQIWIEAVDSTGKVGIVLEDGHVVSTPETRAAKQGDLLGSRTAAE